eukprot:scaffold104359_cov48-Phaeocystis_antarctica.AAC.2
MPPWRSLLPGLEGWDSAGGAGVGLGWPRDCRCIRGIRCVTTEAVVGLPAVAAGLCCGALTPGAEAVPADRSLLGEMTGAATTAAAAAAAVSPPASSAASIAAREQRRRPGRLASAAEGERTSHAAVTGREATSVAYSHAWFTWRASWSALSSTIAPST